MSKPIRQFCVKTLLMAIQVFVVVTVVVVPHRWIVNMERDKAVAAFKQGVEVGVRAMLERQAATQPAREADDGE